MSYHENLKGTSFYSEANSRVESPSSCVVRSTEKSV